MIRVKDKIKLYIQTGEGAISESDFTEYSDGILTISTERGVDKYESPGQQSDSGQLTIVSRNPNIDPYANAEIKSGKTIIVAYEEFENRIFTGNISNVNIEYRPKDNPIVTINAIDAIGALSRSVYWNLPNDYLGKIYWNLREAIQAGLFLYGGAPAVYGSLYNYNQDLDPLGYGAIEGNEQAYDFITKGASSRLGFIYADKQNIVYYYDHNKYLTLDSYVDPVIGPSNFTITPLTATNEDNYKHPADNNIFLTFDSEGLIGNNYKFIELDDGFDRVVNQLEINTTSIRYTDDEDSDVIKDETINWGIYEKTESIETWGVNSALIDGLIPDLFTDGTTVNKEALVDKVAATYLESESLPNIEIISLTFDGRVYPEDALNIDIYKKIRIKHQVNESLTIDKEYLVVGLKDEIDESNWLINLILRPVMEASAMTVKPSISFTASDATNDTRTVYTASVSSAEPIEKISWLFNGPQFSSDLWTRFSDQPNEIDFIITQPTNLIDGNGDIYVAAVVEYENGWKRATNSLIFSNVVKEQPNANFTFVADSPSQTAIFTFTGRDLDAYTNNDDPSSGPVTIFGGNNAQSYLWNFGDGTTSTQKNPIKTYSVPGPGTYNYTVTLTVTTQFGDTDTHQETVTLVIPAVPQALALFSVSQNDPFVTFTNQSVYADTYLWNFGDGNTSTAVNPTHQYQELGTYTVTLTASNINNSDTTTQQITIGSVFYPVKYVKFEWDSIVATQVVNGIRSPLSGIIEAFAELEIRNTSNQLISSNYYSKATPVEPPLDTPLFRLRTFTGTQIINSAWDNNGPRYLTDGNDYEVPTYFINLSEETLSNPTRYYYNGNIVTQMSAGAANLLPNQITARKDIGSIKLLNTITPGQSNKPQEKIRVYVSENNVDWQEIGYISYPDYYVGPTLTDIEMTPIGPMPPRKTA
jgi:PKD repeat protein